MMEEEIRPRKESSKPSIMITPRDIEQLSQEKPQGKRISRKQFLARVTALGLTGGTAYILWRLRGQDFSEALPHLHKDEELKTSLLKGIERLEELDFQVGLNPHFRQVAEDQLEISAFPLLRTKESGESILNSIKEGETEIMCLSEKDMRAYGREGTILGVAKEGDKFIWIITPNILKVDPELIAISSFHEYIHEIYLNTKEYQGHDELTKEAIAYSYTIELFEQLKEESYDVAKGNGNYSNLEFLQKRYDVITYLSQNRQKYSSPPDLDFDEMLWESWLGAIEELGYEGKQ